MDNYLSLEGNEITKVYGALRSELNNLPVQRIRNTCAAAGIDVTRIPCKSEAISGLGSRAEVMPAIDRIFAEMNEKDQITALCIIAEKLIEESVSFEENVRSILGKHGFQYIDGSFVPVDIFDQREAKFLPSYSSSEIARATSRLVEGDYSGAITSACGAVDLLMQHIYKKHGYGEAGRFPFQVKVNTAAKNLQIFESMEFEYCQMGMSKKDASDLVNEMKKATNHAAHVLQILRRSMGDTHGSKPALRQTAYDSIKWSSAICGLFDPIV